MDNLQLEECDTIEGRRKNQGSICENCGVECWEEEKEA